MSLIYSKELFKLVQFVPYVICFFFLHNLFFNLKFHRMMMSSSSMWKNNVVSFKINLQFNSIWQNNIFYDQNMIF
jgi:hypothetical protein